MKNVKKGHLHKKKYVDWKFSDEETKKKNIHKYICEWFFSYKKVIDPKKFIKHGIAGYTCLQILNISHHKILQIPEIAVVVWCS